MYPSGLKLAESSSHQNAAAVSSVMEFWDTLGDRGGRMGGDGLKGTVYAKPFWDVRLSFRVRQERQGQDLNLVRFDPLRFTLDYPTRVAHHRPPQHNRHDETYASSYGRTQRSPRKVFSVSEFLVGGQLSGRTGRGMRAFSE